MSDKLANELLEIIKSSKNFVLDQAPDVAKEIISFGRIIEPLELVVAAIVLGSILWIFRLTYKKVNSDEWDREAWILVGLIGGIGALFSFFGVCGQIECTIKVWFAPKLYLLTYLSHLAHGK